jgi:hypothetical protein
MRTFYIHNCNQVDSIKMWNDCLQEEEKKIQEASQWGGRGGITVIFLTSTPALLKNCSGCWILTWTWVPLPSISVDFPKNLQKILIVNPPIDQK